MSSFDTDKLAQAISLASALARTALMRAVVVPIEHVVKEQRPKKLTGRRGAIERPRSKPRKAPTGVYLVKLREDGSITYPTEKQATEAAALLNSKIADVIRKAMEPDLLLAKSLTTEPQRVEELQQCLQRLNASNKVTVGTIGAPVSGALVVPGDRDGFVKFTGADALQRAELLILLLNDCIDSFANDGLGDIQQSLDDMISSL